MVKVMLTQSEILMAATVGIMRQISALKRCLPDRNGHEGEGWNLHVEGACGEMAVSKLIGVFWSGPINTFGNGADVSTSIQVRTRSRSDYELIVREKDRDEDTFVLVTGTCPNYDVIGWIKGADAKRMEWINSHGGRPEAWFVPHSALNSDLASMKR